MQNAEPVVDVQRDGGCARQVSHVTITGEPVAGKAGTAGSGRGPLEKDLFTGTSPVAYRYCALQIRRNLSSMMTSGVT